MRTIRGGDKDGFVPSLAVLVGVTLAIVGIGVLIFFIHHIAGLIQASSIIASVANETMMAVDRIFPQKLGEGQVDNEEDLAAPTSPELCWQGVPAHKNGYIQSVDSTVLLNLAREYGTLVRMERGIGDFVVKDTPLVSLALDEPPNEKIVNALQAAYNIDRYRTVHQDCVFGSRQIVDIALRALSSGTNDTPTAAISVDYLTAILSRLAPRTIPSSLRYKDGNLRVIAIGPRFAGLVAESFDQIRGSATGNLGIMMRMLGGLQTIASLTANPTRRQSLHDQIRWIAELTERTIESPHDRTRFESRLAHEREALEAKPAQLH